MRPCLLLVLLLLSAKVKAGWKGDMISLPYNVDMKCALVLFSQHALLLLLLLQVKAGWKVQGDVVCLPLNVTMKCMRVLTPDMH
jgi:hypothetical protein